MRHYPLANTFIIRKQNKNNKMSINHPQAEEVLNNIKNLIDRADYGNHKDLVSFVCNTVNCFITKSSQSYEYLFYFISVRFIASVQLLI